MEKETFNKPAESPIHTFYFEPLSPKKEDIMELMLAASHLKTKIRDYVTKRTGVEPLVTIEEGVRQRVVLHCTSPMANDIKVIFNDKLVSVERAPTRDEVISKTGNSGCSTPQKNR